MKKILLLASILYFFIAPFFHHPDNKAVLAWAGYEHGRVWDIWRYGEINFPDKSQFNYPPAHFYLDKIQYAVATFIGGAGYHEWLYKPNSSDAYVEKLSIYSLANKFMLILFAVAVGFVLYLLAKQFGLTEKQSVLVSCLWLFNPIVLYSIPAMGQNDVMAILFFLMGWYFLQKNPVVSAVILGLSISIKTFPILWIPFLFGLSPTLSVRKKIGIFFSSVLVYFLTLAPFITNDNFRKTVLNQDLNQRFFIAQIDLGFSDVVHIVPVLLGLIVMAVLQYKKDAEKISQAIPRVCLAIIALNLTLLGFSHFHPQWYTWVIPFFSLWFVFLDKSEKYLSSLVGLGLFGSWLVVILLFARDSSLSYGMLTPLNPNLATVPVLLEYLTLKKFEPLKFSNYAHTVLATIAVMSIAFLFQKKRYQPEDLPTLPNVFRFPKFLKMLLFSLSAIFMMMLLSVGTNLLPLPQSDPHPEIVWYQDIGLGLTVSKKASRSNLSRADVFFYNPEIKNIDAFTFAIKMNDGTPIKQQVFTGFNTGMEGSVRFDFPTIANSKDKTFILSITPNATAGARLTKPFNSKNYDLQVGYTSTENKDDLAIQLFYQPPATLSEKISNGIRSVFELMQKMPLFFSALIILLWFAL